MSRFLRSVITLTVLITLTSMIKAMGFPKQSCGCGGGGGGCGCGCGGGGGCCGRRKRETETAAVQPHYKADETPCPQTAWKEILDGAILPNDAVASVSSIQVGLYRRYPDQKFLVTCASADEAAKNNANRVHFSSSGDGYCNVVKKRVWCQAVALSA